MRETHAFCACCRASPLRGTDTCLLQYHIRGKPISRRHMWHPLSPHAGGAPSPKDKCLAPRCQKLHWAPLKTTNVPHFSPNTTCGAPWITQVTAPPTSTMHAPPHTTHITPLPPRS